MIQPQKTKSRLGKSRLEKTKLGKTRTKSHLIKVWEGYSLMERRKTHEFFCSLSPLHSPKLLQCPNNFSRPLCNLIVAKRRFLRLQSSAQENRILPLINRPATKNLHRSERSQRAQPQPGYSLPHRLKLNLIPKYKRKIPFHRRIFRQRRKPNLPQADRVQPFQIDLRQKNILP